MKKDRSQKSSTHSRKWHKKRADVGATISATNASAIFTQDVEDMHPSAINQERTNTFTKENQNGKSQRESENKTLETNVEAVSEVNFENYVIKYGTQQRSTNRRNFYRRIKKLHRMD
jgi:hypothetical protein